VIALVSCALAAWEAFAIATKRPTVTELSTRGYTQVLVLGWFLCLGIHFIEARSHDH
jgi:hypothetical protein